MRALAWTLWDARRRPTDILALLAAAAFVGVAARVVLGVATPHEADLLLLPIGVTLALLLRRAPLTQAQALALATAAVAGAAAWAALRIPNNTLIALAPGIVIIAALVCARRPTLALGGVLLCSGAFGSLEVFANIPAAKAGDLLVVGLWISAAVTWVTGPPREVPIRPALLGLGVYLVISLLEVAAADSQQAAIQAFRSQNWHLAVVLLVAYAPWTAETRRRMLRAVIVVGLAVGAYATLRWQTGPTGGEEELALRQPNNFLDGELRPIGSFAAAKELSAWTAMFVPFLIGMALTLRGHWRIVALVASGLCTLGLLAADVRAGFAAVIPATLLVLALYQVAQAFRGRRGAGALLLIIAAGVGSISAFAVTLGDKQGTNERYTNILHPERDESYQARLVKWRTALNDIQDAPFGHGIGTSGRAQKRFGAYQNIASLDIDNSYLKVAFEQGFVIMVILAAALVMIMITLVKGAAIVLDPARAGPAIAASGTLLAMLTLFWVGNYIEGLPVLGGWTLVGLGMGALGARQAAPPAEPA
jgi:hypothetical protein